MRCRVPAAQSPTQSRPGRKPRSPQSYPPIPRDQIEAVRKAFDAGHNAEALRLANTFSAQQKNNAEFHTQLGVVLATNKQYKAAQLELEKANALKPDTFDILFPLAQTYIHNGKDADAELALNRALKLRPDSPETQYLLAEIYFRQSKSSDALDLLVRAHKAAPQKYRHHLPARARQHDAKLFRRRDPAARIRHPARPQTRRSPRRARRKLFHGGQRRKSDRGFQIAHRNRSLPRRPTPSWDFPIATSAASTKRENISRPA